MDPGRHRHHRGGIAADADFVGVGFALVLSAVSCLLFATVGNNTTVLLIVRIGIRSTYIPVKIPIFF